MLPSYGKFHLINFHIHLTVVATQIIKRSGSRFKFLAHTALKEREHPPPPQTDEHIRGSAHNVCRDSNGYYLCWEAPVDGVKGSQVSHGWS